MNTTLSTHRVVNTTLSTHRVEVRKGLGQGNWRDYNEAILEISLDNKRFTGDHLHSILMWGSQKFTKIHVIICDTLQRFNLRFDKGLSETSARLQARKFGDIWVENHRDLLESSSIEYEIYRWNDWKTPTSSYRKDLNALKRTYNTHKPFRSEIDDYINDVWQQRSASRNLNNSMYDVYRETVLKPYFFEETAITSVFLQQLNAISAYPGSLPPFWESLISGKYPILKGFRGHTFLRLDLSRRKSIAS